MTDFLFDSPWWLMAVLAVAGVTLFWNGNRRQDTTLRSVGMALAALAAVLLAVGYFVDTPTERAEKSSRQLARAVQQRDWTTVGNLLDPRTSLSVMNAMTLYDTRDQIVAAAQDAVERWKLKNLRVLSSTAERTDTFITVTMNVYSDQEATMGYPLTTSWVFEWRQAGDTWRLDRIVCLRIGDRTGESAERMFPRR